MAITVVYSNYRAASNKWLGVFILSGLAWLVANLLANIAGHDLYWNLVYSRAALVGSSLVPYAFLMFCLTFTAHRISTLQRVLIFLPIVALLAVAPTGLNVQSVSEGGANINPGPAYVILLIVIVAYFYFGIRVLVHEYRRATDVKKSQLYYILLGTLLTVIPGLVLSGVLPLLGYSKAVAFSPVLVLIFSAFTSIAIVRHRLFDVRLVIARSLGYAGSLALIAALYGFVVFGIAELFFGAHFSFFIQAYILFATAIVALTFPYLRKIFDRFTNRLFYQDAYDPQELFGHLNGVLVSSLDVQYLMMQSLSVIETALKPGHATVVLINNNGEMRSFATKKNTVDAEDLAALRQHSSGLRGKVIMTNYLDDPKRAPFHDLLQKNSIAAVVRLTQNARSTEEGFGYLLLGVKKSGNPYTPQDARVLDTVANELIIAIQNALHYEEIQRFNEVLQSRVDDATRKLRRTNEKLKDLDETKDDFISMASHQLRTPLTSVKGYLSMVLEGDAGKINDTQKKMLGQAFVSSQRMVYLIADLLNVSRLRTGKFMIEPSRTDLSVMIGEELAQLVETAAARDIQLTYDKPKDYPLLMLDETKTRQVIMNFVDNAIYYTPAGGHIRVELTATSTAAELRVVDDGIGVPKAEQHHLFTKFYRAGNARKARPDGTGLGLFMAKKVVLAQGGTIIFDSHEGKGSVFGFSFPLSKLRVTESTPPAQPIIAKIPVAK
jgi:signal transduction histidine kinase